MNTYDTKRQTAVRPTDRNYLWNRADRGSRLGTSTGLTRLLRVGSSAMSRRLACAKRVLVTVFAAMFVATSVWGQGSQGTPDVTAMSVEDLMNMQVTSVSKRTQKVADAAAAVFVITQEDIQRSGARNIPEALRMVPG